MCQEGQNGVTSLLNEWIRFGERTEGSDVNETGRGTKWSVVTLRAEITLPGSLWNGGPSSLIILLRIHSADTLRNSLVEPDGARFENSRRTRYHLTSFNTTINSEVNPQYIFSGWKVQSLIVSSLEILKIPLSLQTSNLKKVVPFSVLTPKLQGYFRLQKSIPLRHSTSSHPSVLFLSPYFPRPLL